MSETTYDVVVIGGGPSGLNAAWELRDKSLLLLEKSHRLGGRLYSMTRGDMWLNVGGHLFPAPGSYMRNLVMSIGLETIPIPGNKFALWFGGKLHKPGNVSALPLTLPISIDESLALARVGLKIRKASGAWLEEMKPRQGEPSDKRRARVSRFMSSMTFRDYLGAMPPRVDALFRAAAQRSAAEPEDISAGVGAALFGMVWAGKGDAMAVNLAGGSGRLGDTMAELLGDRALTHAKVLNVEKQGGLVRVTYEKDGRQQTVSAAQAIVAVPAMFAAEIAKGIPAPLAELLRRVHYGPFPSMGVITNETGPAPWDDVYAITVAGETINMMFHHSNPVPRGTGRKQGSSFMVYTGGKQAAEMMTLGEDQIRERYLADMFKIYPELRNVIAETKVQIWSPGNTYRPAGFDFSAMLTYCDRTDNDIHFAGDYFADLGNMETAAGTGFEAARRVRTRLASLNVKREAA